MDKIEWKADKSLKRRKHFDQNWLKFTLRISHARWPRHYLRFSQRTADFRWFLFFYNSTFFKASGESQVLIFLKIWSFYSRALYILPANDSGRCPQSAQSMRVKGSDPSGLLTTLQLTENQSDPKMTQKWLWQTDPKVTQNKLKSDSGSDPISESFLCDPWVTWSHSGVGPQESLLCHVWATSFFDVLAQLSGVENWPGGV